MKSTRSDDLCDLECDLPTRAEDVEALRRFRPGPMSFPEYLRFLRRVSRPSHQGLRARSGPRGKPFTLA